MAITFIQAALIIQKNVYMYKFQAMMIIITIITIIIKDKQIAYSPTNLAVSTKNGDQWQILKPVFK